MTGALGALVGRIVGLVVVAALAGVVRADGDAEFRAAVKLAADRDPRALAAFEALGAARPSSRWTDDAWVEAARLAERAGDYDRARKDLGEAIAIGGQLDPAFRDDQLLRRARGDLARLVAMTGRTGEWSAVAAEHDRLVTRAAAGDDPTPALEALEVLARAHREYPRAVAIRLALARGWEEEAEVDRALGWLRDAIRIAGDADRDRARTALVRTLIRGRDLAAARAELAQITDPLTRAGLARDLATAEHRTTVRRIVGAGLALLLGLAIVTLRRRTGSWSATVRTLARPPTEVLYALPIAAVVGAIALTGNPLVGQAVVYILLAGLAIAWLSGSVLEVARRGGPLGIKATALHALVVIVGVSASVYLIIDHVRLLDLVGDTWRTGPSAR